MKKLDVPQSGSQASTTASRNRFGQYNRTRATPVNPNSPRQSLVRGYLSDASQAWRALDDTERAAWNSFAAVTGKNDSLGQTIYPTGHQRFVGMWSALTNAGLATPPDVPSEAPPGPPAASVLDFSASSLSLTITDTISTTVRALVFMSPQVSQGVSFNRDLRWILTRSTALTANELQCIDEYVAKFGALIVGKRVFVRVQLITLLGGVSAPTEFSGVIQ